MMVFPFSNLSLRPRTLNGVRMAGVVLALGAAFDDEGLRVGELDADVLLVDAWQLAVQEVILLLLADVELGCESAQDLRVLAARVAGV